MKTVLFLLAVLATGSLFSKERASVSTHLSEGGLNPEAVIKPLGLPAPRVTIIITLENKYQGTSARAKALREIIKRQLKKQGVIIEETFEEIGVLAGTIAANKSFSSLEAIPGVVAVEENRLNFPSES